MSVKHLLALALSIFLFSSAQAQQKCGTHTLLQQLSAQYPALQQMTRDIKQGVYDAAANKTTVQEEQHAIPVVFHIVINNQQLSYMGGMDGLRRRIDSQMVVLNRDFNAENADSVNIPTGFKPLYGNTGIHFALARTTPGGNATDGFDIKIINQQGINLENGIGSGNAFSNAKYAQAVGLNAWDPTRYMNVWVINPLENGSPSNILGVAMPYYYIEGTGGSIPRNEMGIVLHYLAFGKKSGLTDIYIQGADGGRTLTHEMGHMFRLFHIWGDDDGKCAGRGGDDDGISDTPPQAYSTSGCPTYPKYDGCSPTGDGIMFMNYMDYSNDKCVAMFTREQVTRMQGLVRQGNPLYSLTKHPELLTSPTDSNTTANNYVVYPNPTEDVVNILFTKSTDKVTGLYVINLMGQVVARQEVTVQNSYYSFNLSGAQTGLYILVIDFGDRRETAKIMVQ